MKSKIICNFEPCLVRKKDDDFSFYKHLKMCLMSNEGLLSPRCGSSQSVSGHSLHTDAPACGPDNQVMTLVFFCFFFFFQDCGKIRLTHDSDGQIIT